MEKEIIKKIIESGNFAPSGGNSQPWSFIVKDNKITVLAFPDKDHQILNFKNRGTWIAHGAMMENIKIASLFFGYRPIFEISNNMLDRNISTIISFEKIKELSEKEKELLDIYSYIKNRHSNRKPYSKDPLDEKEKDYLFRDLNDFSSCKLSFVEKDNIYEAAKNLPFDSILSFKNKILHEHLFKEIIWKENDQKIRGGLYLKTMEVYGPKALVFKLLKNWKIARFLYKIGFFKKVYQENVKTVCSSALVGCVCARDKDIDFIEAGKLIENIWLRASKLGLGFQLITGVPFLWQRINFGTDNIFSDEEKNIINKAYNDLSKIFQVKDKIIVSFFRVGKPVGPPSAISYKRPPIIEWN
jgi:hypothetical protein